MELFPIRGSVVVPSEIILEGTAILQSKLMECVRDILDRVKHDKDIIQVFAPGRHRSSCQEIQPVCAFSYFHNSFCPGRFRLAVIVHGFYVMRLIDYKRTGADT